HALSGLTPGLLPHARRPPRDVAAAFVYPGHARTRAPSREASVRENPVAVVPQTGHHGLTVLWSAGLECDGDVDLVDGKTARDALVGDVNDVRTGVGEFGQQSDEAARSVLDHHPCLQIAPDG